MGIQEEWTVLRTHIEAVIGAAAPVTAWQDGVQPVLVNQAALIVVADCEGLWSAIDSFLNAHRASLPPATGGLMNDWRQHRGFIPTPSGNASPVHVAIAWVCLLASIKGNVDRLLADSEVVWRATTERAFEHLQQTIVVDPDARRRWKDAFEENEPACERLGAIHLLWHGIWGFKVHAGGERTDLVVGELIDAATIGRAARAGTALVLTEWKRVTQKLSVPAATQAIEKQVKRYRRGSLAGVELKRTCYGVLVSKKHVPPPSDRAFADFAIRFVNLVVDPDTPSGGRRDLRAVTPARGRASRARSTRAAR
jgi:hypothetical protein